MTDQRAAEGLPEHRPEAARKPVPKVRTVTAIQQRRAGVSELHLECGHVLRRRLALCPPSRVICPHC